MSKVEFYILRQVGIGTLFIAGALTAVIWLTQSMRFIKFILNRGLPLETFLELTMLLLPSFLLVILPIALYLSTMFVFNKMLNDRELVVMRSSGLSDFDLARPVIALCLSGMLVCYLISLYVLPVSFREFRSLQDDVRDNFSVGLIQQGRFNNLGDDLTIYVRERVGDDLRGILVQDSRDPEKTFTMMAERGTILSAKANPRVLMERGNRQERDRKTGKISILYFERYSFRFTFGKSQNRTYLQPNERFLGQLLSPGNSPEERHYRKTLIAEGHNRLIAPLYALALPLLGLVSMLVGQFNKRGQTIRILIGLGIAGSVEAAAIGLHSASAKLQDLILLAYANVILSTLACLVLLVRPDWSNALVVWFDQFVMRSRRRSMAAE
ncbi:MAG: LptF/LptG family permease [Rhodospirillaceae bacterium]|nr:LptF/LptG family permease [Rhodospirillaceae bacterium]